MFWQDVQKINIPGCKLFFVLSLFVQDNVLKIWKFSSFTPITHVGKYFHIMGGGGGQSLPHKSNTM